MNIFNPPKHITKPEEKTDQHFSESIYMEEKITNKLTKSAINGKVLP